MTLKSSKGCITIESVIDGEKITSDNECIIYEKDNCAIVFYNETEEALAADVKSKLRIEKDKVTLRREGSYSSFMQFEKGRSFHFPYHMPYGAIDMEISTRELSVSRSGEALSVAIEYWLDNGSGKSENKMNIVIKKL